MIDLSIILARKWKNIRVEAKVQNHHFISDPNYFITNILYGLYYIA